MFLLCVCVCVSVSGVLFSVGVCVCDLLIFLLNTVHVLCVVASIGMVMILNMYVKRSTGHRHTHTDREQHP